MRWLSISCLVMFALEVIFFVKVRLPHLQHYYVSDYERLRIGGLVFACLLVAGGIGVVLCKYPNHTERKKNFTCENKNSSLQQRWDWITVCLHRYQVRQEEQVRWFFPPLLFEPQLLCESLNVNVRLPPPLPLIVSISNCRPSLHSYLVEKGTTTAVKSDLAPDKPVSARKKGKRWRDWVRAGGLSWNTPVQMVLPA